MSTIVGMFDDHQQAQQVINELDGLGLEEGSIHVLTREGVESGGTFLSSIARAVRPGSGELSSELIRLGLNRQEAEYYEEELDPEGVVVLVQAQGEQGDRAMEILRKAHGTVRND